MPANPFQTNDPIPAAKGPLSGEAHYDIDSFATIDLNQNPSGTMPDGSGRGGTILAGDQKAQPGAPAYQKAPAFKQGRC